MVAGIILLCRLLLSLSALKVTATCNSSNCAHPTIQDLNDAATTIEAQLTSDSIFHVPSSPGGTEESTPMSDILTKGITNALTHRSADDDGYRLLVSWTAPPKAGGLLAAYVLFVVNSSHHCLQRVIITSESDVQLEESSFLLADCKMSLVANQSLEEAMDYEISVLNSDAVVNITVYPIINERLGNPRAVTVCHLEKEPSAPRGIQFAVVDAHTIEVTWEQPIVKPCQNPNYTLTILTTKVPYEQMGYNQSGVILKTGWETNKIVVPDLLSGWQYCFLLEVRASTGHAGPFQSSILTTLESPPGVVQALNVTGVADDYRKAVITWDCPVLKERNGHIMSFTLKYFSKPLTRPMQLTIVPPVSARGDVQCEGQHFYSVVDVVPGSSYRFVVTANNEKFQGNESSLTYLAPIGTPPNIILEPFQELLPLRYSSFVINYCAHCLINDTNGEVTYFAILVCATEYCSEVSLSNLEHQSVIEGLNTWHLAANKDFQTLYRPTNHTWQDLVRNLSVSEFSKTSLYVVGEDNECTRAPVETYCNGPLPSGRAFRVAFVSCTKTACNPSEFGDEHHTKQETEKSSTWIVLVAVFIASIVVLLVLGLLFRRIHATKRQQSLQSLWTLVKGQELTLSNSKALHKLTVVGENDITKGQELALSNSKALHKLTVVGENDITNDLGRSALNLIKISFIMRDFVRNVEEIMESEKSESNLPKVFTQQFQQLRNKSPRHDHTTALMGANKVKNRYTNILPFNHSRVRLQQLEVSEKTDYINASYIPGYHSKREYIATQGPIESTVNDFWRMVWEQHALAIVMLSAFKEGSLSKVYPYFPAESEINQPHVYSSVKVTLTEVSSFGSYSVRTFKLLSGRVQRTVYHFLMDSWHDCSTSLNVGSVLQFVKEVRSLVPANGKYPLIVHCSSGVGKTSTFIAIDYFMHYIKDRPATDTIDIFRFVLEMRENRMDMVQTADQYVFLFKTVSELVRRKTEISHCEDSVFINQGFV